MILSIDEAGMGPWAGPLVVGGVIASNWIQEQFEQGIIHDSKQVSASRRSSLAPLIAQQAVWWCVRFISVHLIDEHGLGVARALAIQSIVEEFPCVLELVLVDGIGSRQYVQDDVLIDTRYVMKGDQSVAGIAAASIMAKVARDSAMYWYDQRYPGYGFAAHKGYGTKRHQHTLNQYGVSPIHRTSFAPVQVVMNRTVENIAR